MAQNMPLRKLGKSDLTVSAVGLGCWQFAQGKGFFGNYWATLKDEEILEIIRTSLGGGVNWFDTAEAYGGGQSERALSGALKTLGVKPEAVLIATKWRPFFRTARSIIETIDARLEALDGYPIALHQIHQPFSLSPVRLQMNAMADLVQAGKIRYVGVSNFSASRMRLAHQELGRRGLPLVSNQVRYNLLDRSIEKNGILDAARELGISIIAYSPLAQGLLTGKFHERPQLIRSKPGFRKHLKAFRPSGLGSSYPVVEALRRQAKKYGRTPGQIALNWLLSAQGEMVVAIPGATSAAQARENAGATDFTMSHEDMEFLSSTATGNWP